MYELFIAPLTETYFQKALIGGSIVAIVAGVVGVSGVPAEGDGVVGVRRVGGEQDLDVDLRAAEDRQAAVDRRRRVDASLGEEPPNDFPIRRVHRADGVTINVRCEDLAVEIGVILPQKISGSHRRSQMPRHRSQRMGMGKPANTLIEILEVNHG